MEFIANMEEMQKTADYRFYKNKIKGGAIGSILFGIIAVGMGIHFFNIFNLILISIGLFLFTCGIWAIIDPNPTSLILDGVALIMVGLWNIVLAALEIAFGDFGVGIWLVAGIWQVVAGIQSFKESKKFTQFTSWKPEGHILKEVEEILKKIKKENPKKENNIIEFRLTSLKDSATVKGELVGDRIVLVKLPREQIYFLNSREIEIEVKGKVLIGKQLKVEVKIKDESNSGLIFPESYERYEKWKSQMKKDEDIIKAPDMV
ncbi:MAG: hypothetical protein K8T10_18560 [Candidatus Eremiobacteraeota bacterium]|nr:hypothetical protein [Candidatus Eremiobacteraeota bacterium]